jgi:hypothetical protein
VTGQLVLGVVLALYAAGLAWLHRLAGIAAPGRFLNQPARPAGEPRPRRVRPVRAEREARAET